MRRKPLATIELEFKAQKAKGGIIVDQNFTAKSVSETDREWKEWLSGVFNLAVNNNKRLCYQTEADYFNRIDKELLRLTGRATLAVLCGIEQPRKTKGSALKNPEDFRHEMDIIRKLGILSLVTAVTGLSPGADQNRIKADKWKKFVGYSGANPDLLAIFPLMHIRGAGDKPTSVDDPDPLAGYRNKSRPEDWRLANEIARDF